MTEPTEPQGDFVAAFESAFARLQVRVEEACAREVEWPRAVAAGMRAIFEFAAAEPIDAYTLTNKALAQGRAGAERHRKLVAYAGRLLEPGRAVRADSPPPPPVLEGALAGGIAFLVAHRLAQGNEAELPGLAAEAIEFVLTPYLGADEARRVARA